MAGLNPFPSKSQCRVARPRQAQLPVGLVLVRLYLFLQWDDRSKMPDGEGEGPQRARECSQNPLGSTGYTVPFLFPLTIPSSLGRGLCGG